MFNVKTFVPFYVLCMYNVTCLTIFGAQITMTVTARHELALCFARRWPLVKWF